MLRQSDSFWGLGSASFRLTLVSGHMWTKCCNNYR